MVAFSKDGRQLECANCDCKHFRVLRPDKFCNYLILQCVDCDENVEGIEVKES